MAASSVHASQRDASESRSLPHDPHHIPQLLHHLRRKQAKGIEDQLPVSENSEIAVERLPSTTAPTTTNLRDRRGVLEWAFEAKPGELRAIAFAWRVRWPKDKGVVIIPSG